MKHGCLSLALYLSLLVPPAYSADTKAPPETVGEFLSRSLDENIGPFVQHCSAALPENQESLQTEYGRYKGRLEEATAGFRQRMMGRAYVDQPMPQDLAVGLRRPIASRLDEVKTQDPKTYCANLHKNVESWTVEALAKRMEEQFVRLEAIDNLGAKRGSSR